MKKSIATREYSLFLAHLREVRERKGLTQAEVAERLDQTQSFVSKVERGERRLDVLEARAFCLAIGVDFVQFVQQLEGHLR